MEPSGELKDLLLRFYDALAGDDAPFVERQTSREGGALIIGTDPQEWWAGHDAIVRAVTAQVRELGEAGLAITPGDIGAYREGSVGWAADQPEFRLGDGTIIPLRVTCVFHQEGGGWKLVQMHASVGQRNEEAMGRELTV